MADYFASIFGTEKDKNLYENPRNSSKSDGKFVTEEEDQQHFDEFFEDIFVELEERYGPIEEMNVCDNLGDHLIGNVYVKFKSEEDAERAVNELNERWFGGKPVYAELSTVTDFREAGCRQYEIGACTRGGFCNFMHLKQISDNLKRHLFGTTKGTSSSSLRHRSSARRSHRSHISRSRSKSRSRSSSLTRHKSSRHRRHRSHKSSRKSSRHRHRTSSPSRSGSLSGSSLTPRHKPGARSPRSRSRTPEARSPLSRSPSSIRRASRTRSRSLSPERSAPASKFHQRTQNRLLPPSATDVQSPGGD